MTKYEGHTPGPWQHYAFGSDEPIGPYILAVTVNTEGLDGPVHGYTITCGTPRPGVSTYWPARGVGGRSDTEAEANARLIADAPLLLRQRDMLLEEVKAALTTLKLDPVIRPCALTAMVNLLAAIAACERNENA